MSSNTLKIQRVTETFLAYLFINRHNVEITVKESEIEVLEVDDRQLNIDVAGSREERGITIYIFRTNFSILHLD